MDNAALDWNLEKTADKLVSAMRATAASVALVTTNDGERRFSMSVTAMNSLSLDPPSVIICINGDASIHAPLFAGRDFCVNLLSSGHAEMAIDCSGRLNGEARFEKGNWELGSGEIPYLGDAQANLFCQQDGQIRYGTHTIFIGKVLDVRLGRKSSPLLYVDGKYTAPKAEENSG